MEEYRLWFDDMTSTPPRSPGIPRSPRSPGDQVRPCFVRLEDVTSQCKGSSSPPPGASVPALGSRLFYGGAASVPSGPSRVSRKDRHHHSAARTTSQSRGRSLSVAVARERDKSKCRRSLSCSRKGKAKAPAKASVKATVKAPAKGPAKTKDDVLKCGLCLMPFHLHSSLRKHVQGHQERTPHRLVG